MMLWNRLLYATVLASAIQFLTDFVYELFDTCYSPDLWCLPCYVLRVTDLTEYVKSHIEDVRMTCLTQAATRALEAIPVYILLTPSRIGAATFAGAVEIITSDMVPAILDTALFKEAMMD